MFTMNDFLQNLRNGQAEKQRTAKTRKSYDSSYHYNTQRFQSYAGYQPPRQQNIKRPPQQPGPAVPYAPEETTMDVLAEAVETLSIHVESLAKNQEFLISAQDRAADMLERQASAIEEIARCLQSFKIATPKVSSPETPVHKTAPADRDVSAMEQPDPKAEAPEQPVRPRRRILKKSRKTGLTQKIELKQYQEAQAPVESEKKRLNRDTVMEIIHTMRDEGATYDQIAKHLIHIGQPTFSGRGEWHAQTIHRLFGRKK